jgi:predicted nucleotidyltransferase
MSEQGIQNIVDTIVTEFNPEKIVLFGSYAWGKPGKDSDVDLFVVKDDPQKNTREMAIDLERLLFKREMALDLLVYKPDQLEKRLKIKDPFITKIWREGKTLYERQ